MEQTIVRVYPNFDSQFNQICHVIIVKQHAVNSLYAVITEMRHPTRIISVCVAFDSIIHLIEMPPKTVQVILGLKINLLLWYSKSLGFFESCEFSVFSKVVICYLTICEQTLILLSYFYEVRTKHFFYLVAQLQ